MKNLTGNSYYLYGILFLYILFLGIGISYHEFWMDESHHWLIARDSNSLIDLFNNYKYDGHPMFWVSCLWVIGKFTSQVIIVQVFHAIIAIITAYILLFKSPFKKSYSILFIFGYYPLFEYGMLSRNYAITILFLLLFCLYYRKNGKLLLPFIFLGLASNGHLFGLIFSVILGIKIIYDERLRFKNNLIPIAILLAMVIISFITIKAPSDHYFYFDTSRILDFRISENLSTVWWKTIVPIPDFWGQGHWNTNFFLANFNKITLIFASLCWIIPLLVLKRKSGNYLVFYFYVIAIIAFCHVTGLHISQRIGGFLLFALLVLVWIEKKTMNNSNYMIRINKTFKSYLLYTFLVIQIGAALLLIKTDISRPFSNTKNIYNFLDSNAETNTPVYGGLYCNYIGVNNYGDLNLHIASQDEKLKYCDWRILNLNGNKSDLGEGIKIMISKDYKEMILLSPSEIVGFDKPSYKLKLIGHIKNGMVNNENAFIYKISKVD